MDIGIFSIGIPNINPADMDTKMNAMNGLIFNQEINKIKNKMETSKTGIIAKFIDIRYNKLSKYTVLR